MPPHRSARNSIGILLAAWSACFFLVSGANADGLFGAGATSLRYERQDETPKMEVIEEGSGTEFVRLVAMWENDGIFKGFDRTDRYYSNGLKLDAAWALHAEGDTRRGFGLSIGHAIYTPDRIFESRLREDDRPYAGRLYGAAYWQWDSQWSEGVRTLDHLEFDLGVVGPSSYADSIQRGIHTGFDQTRPRGWDNQLKDEIAVDLTYRKKWRIDLSEESEAGLGFELIPALEGTVGTVYRRVGGGFTLRGGINLPDDYGPMRIDDVASAVSNGALAGEDYSLYGFVGVFGRLTEHNIFLDGNQFRDSHSVDKKPYTAEVRLGLEFKHASGFHASYSWTIRTEQFWGQDGGHSFSTIVLGWSRDF